MPQLLFQFQHNGVSKDGPFLETLIHILNQRKITYDGIQNHQHSDAVSVDFSSPEEAKNAYKTLDGKLFFRFIFFVFVYLLIIMYIVRIIVAQTKMVPRFFVCAYSV